MLRRVWHVVLGNASMAVSMLSNGRELSSPPLPSSESDPTTASPVGGRAPCRPGDPARRQVEGCLPEILVNELADSSDLATHIAQVELLPFRVIRMIADGSIRSNALGLRFRDH